MITEIDFSILYMIQSIRCGFLDVVMPFLSSLNNHGEIWIAVGVILLCTKRYRTAGFSVLIGLLLGLIFGNGILKHLIARPRPCWLNMEVPLLIPVPDDFSFPSGHTLSSFIAVFLLAKTDKRFGYASIPLAVLIAFSRLYLFVHFPTDILGGIALAAVISFIVWQGKKRICAVKSTKCDIK